LCEYHPGDIGVSVADVVALMHRAALRYERFQATPASPAPGSTQEEALLGQSLEGWLKGTSTGESPRLLDRFEHGSLFLDQVEALGSESQRLLLEFLAAEEAERPWKGQLITGSESSLRGAVKEGRFDANLALRLERVRIVLDPEQAGPDR
jgi:DNA-binding NtrC family response regulator